MNHSLTLLGVSAPEKETIKERWNEQKINNFATEI
jgi:hypothetical protein